MISFGFTIYKFFGKTSTTPEGQRQLLTPRIVDMVMIIFGLLSLLLALVQQQIAVEKLKEYYPATPKIGFFSAVCFGFDVWSCIIPWCVVQTVGEWKVIAGNRTVRVNYKFNKL